MEMITVPVSIPKDMLLYIDIDDTKLSFEQNAMLLYPLIREGVISHGRAAEVIGVPKWNLIEFYDSMGLPYLNQSADDLRDEIASFAILREKSAK